MDGFTKTVRLKHGGGSLNGLEVFFISLIAKTRRKQSHFLQSIQHKASHHRSGK